MSENKFEDQYPEKDFQKNIYTFKSQEIAKLAPWDCDIQKAEIAKQVITSIIRTECLKRVGVKPSPDVGITYDVIKENFILYVPRHWCSMCQNRKAVYSVGTKLYCENCIAILKSQQSERVEDKKDGNNAKDKKVEHKKDEK